VIPAGESLRVVAPERRSGGEQHPQHAIGGAGQEMIEPGQALGVGPLRVFDPEHERRLLGNAKGGLRQCDPQRIARPTGIFPLRQRLVGHELPEQADRSRVERSPRVLHQSAGGFLGIFRRHGAAQAGDAAGQLGGDSKGVALGKSFRAREHDAR
jgi:hypothetical protein